MVRSGCTLFVFFLFNVKCRRSVLVTVMSRKNGFLVCNSSEKIKLKKILKILLEWGAAGSWFCSGVHISIDLFVALIMIIVWVSSSFLGRRRRAN